jgi:hypothetical protein
MSDKKDKHNKYYWDTDRNKSYTYTTTPIQKVMMSVPEGLEFNKPYPIKNRKDYPMYTGLVKYFPDALMEVSKVSRIGNEQHHAGEPLHWDKSKSMDHLDALFRHLTEADEIDDDGVLHLAKVAWRALAALQTKLEDNGNDK